MFCLDKSLASLLFRVIPLSVRLPVCSLQNPNLSFVLNSYLQFRLLLLVFLNDTAGNIIPRISTRNTHGIFMVTDVIRKRTDIPL